MKNVLKTILCCGVCNKARGDRYSMEEFKVMVNALLKYRKEQSRPALKLVGRGV